MKNTRFLQPHRARTRSFLGVRGIIAIVFAILLVLIAPQWLDRGILSLSTPFLKARVVLAQSVVGVRTHLLSREELEAENERLRAENSILKVKGALYDEERAAYERIAAFFPASGVGDGVLTHVLASPNASPYDSFIVSAGSAEGVLEGDEAVALGSVSVGIVDLVAEHSSRVRLFSSPEYKHDVTVGSGAVLFSAEGKGGGMFLVRVPKDAAVSLSDAIRRADGGTLGFVQTVESVETDSFQSVTATMPINLFETREVVLRKNRSLSSL